MNKRFCCYLLLSVFFFFGNCQSLAFAQTDSTDGFVPLFDGVSLKGWKRVNTAESTWRIEDGMLICNGKPIGQLRTQRMYQNFILELEWRHMKPKGNAGIFVWADDITAKGVPFHRSIEVQVLENAYGNTRGYTTHGDIFPIHGAKMSPENGRGGNRAFPTENRSKPSPEWNHYQIKCMDGEISLAVNGKVVTRGKECVPRKGYICIESEGGVVHYRNMRIKELPESKLDPELIAIADRGYRCLYEGVDFSGWNLNGKWKSQDWRILKQDDQSGWLKSKSEFGDCGLLIDFRSSRKLPEFEFRGVRVSPATFESGVLAKGQGWNRIRLEAKDGKLEVVVNDRQLGKSASLSEDSGPLIIHATGKVELANIYVAEIE